MVISGEKKERETMKICTIIGARPQFVKAAAVSAKIAEMNKDNNNIEEIIIHTGQHYDEAMSKIFFDELGIPKEKYNLEIGSASHGKQTGLMLEKIEDILQIEKPDWVLIYGDTNSTLAGALAAVKMHIPVAHVEAGMRSFNRKMPEEINRIVSDHTCQLNLCSTNIAVENLKKEDREETAFLVGDVMYDCSLKFADLAEKTFEETLFANYAIKEKEYILMTCHRAENTDDELRLSQIVDAVNELAEKTDVVYPIHPRTKSYLEKYHLSFSEKVKVIKPVSYLEMLLLEKYANLILTDSGGVQKEAFFFKVPCVTMRDETEWVETVELGVNFIVGADKNKIISTVIESLNNNWIDKFANIANPYGDGNASGKIINIIKSK